MDSNNRTKGCEGLSTYSLICAISREVYLTGIYPSSDSTVRTLEEVRLKGMNQSLAILLTSWISDFLLFDP